MIPRDLAFVPAVVPHPGEVVAEYLDHLGWSVADLSVRASIPAVVVGWLVAGRIPVSPAIASRLERVLGRPASFWSNLQRRRDEATIAQERVGTEQEGAGERLRRQIATEGAAAGGESEEEGMSAATTEKVTDGTADESTEARPGDAVDSSDASLWDPVSRARRAVGADEFARAARSRHQESRKSTAPTGPAGAVLLGCSCGWRPSWVGLGHAGTTPPSEGARESAHRAHLAEVGMRARREGLARALAGQVLEARAAGQQVDVESAIAPLSREERSWFRAEIAAASTPRVVGAADAAIQAGAAVRPPAAPAWIAAALAAWSCNLRAVDVESAAAELFRHLPLDDLALALDGVLRVAALLGTSAVDPGAALAAVVGALSGAAPAGPDWRVSSATPRSAGEDEPVARVVGAPGEADAAVVPVPFPVPAARVGSPAVDSVPVVSAEEDRTRLLGPRFPEIAPADREVLDRVVARLAAWEGGYLSDAIRDALRVLDRGISCGESIFAYRIVARLLKQTVLSGAERRAARDLAWSTLGRAAEEVSTRLARSASDRDRAVASALSRALHFVAWSAGEPAFADGYLAIHLALDRDLLVGFSDDDSEADLAPGGRTEHAVRRQVVRAAAFVLDEARAAHRRTSTSQLASR